jgi:flagellar biosynthesis/type III secretory pathway chaperone
MGSHTELLGVLKEQATVVDELIGLGMAETSAFKTDDVHRIIAIIDQQKEVVARMWRLEQRKTDIIRGIGDELPERGEWERVPEVTDETLKEIEEMGDHLVELANRLQEINETNRLLARMSLSYANVMLKALGTVNGSYDADGQPYGASGSIGRVNTSA